MYKILGKAWYTPIIPGQTIMDLSQYCIGVVAIKSGPNDNNWKCYIGLGLNVDEDADAQEIAAHGQKMTKEVACAYFPDLPAEGFKS